MKKPPIVWESGLPTWVLMTGFVAVLGLLGLGSLIALAAPADGQTGMFVFFLWGLGFVIWLVCFVAGAKSRRIGFIGLGVFCAVVMALTLYASDRAATRIYAERAARQKHN